MNAGKRISLFTAVEDNWHGLTNPHIMFMSQPLGCAAVVKNWGLFTDNQLSRESHVKLTCHVRFCTLTGKATQLMCCQEIYCYD